MINAQEAALLQLFNPYFFDQYQRLAAGNGRFVHYTSADAALKVLSSRSVWLRNARTMNDFSEIQYGLELLADAYRSPLGDRLKHSLSILDPSICSEIESLFNGWSPRFPEVTYLACVSEHDELDENKIGRLSMWRAYGGPTSVALVLNNRPFLAPTDVLHVYTSPVLYADSTCFNKQFERLVANLEQAGPVLSQLGREHVHNRLFNAFLFATLCTKHPGFREEREWRVIHTEKMHPSTHLAKDVETIRGVPQFVYKIPLREIPGSPGEDGFHGAEVKDLLDRIIIGPSDSGLVIRDAFIHLLEEAGVADPYDKVLISGIPLR